MPQIKPQWEGPKPDELDPLVIHFAGKEPIPLHEILTMVKSESGVGVISKLGLTNEQHHYIIWLLQALGYIEDKGNFYITTQKLQVWGAIWQA